MAHKTHNVKHKKVKLTEYKIHQSNGVNDFVYWYVITRNDKQSYNYSSPIQLKSFLNVRWALGNPGFDEEEIETEDEISVDIAESGVTPAMETEITNEVETTVETVEGEAGTEAGEGESGATSGSDDSGSGSGGDSGGGDSGGGGGDGGGSGD